MSEKTLGVAVVGCGSIGRTHVLAVQALTPKLAVVALVDADRASAERASALIVAAGFPEPTLYTDLTDALADPRIELVAIGTPSGMHIDLGVKALEAGRHVVIEKPLDVVLDRAREIEQAAEAASRRGIVASVISQERFERSSRAVADAIATGAFGRVTTAVASVSWWRSQAYYDSAGWRGTWALDGGGALMNQGVHTVDLLLSFLGKPVEISARTGLLAHDRVEVEDVAVATVAFESGALATLSATTAAYPGITERIQVMGSRGSATIDGGELTFFYAAGDDDPTGANPPQGVNQASAVLAGYPETGDLPIDEHITNPAGHVRQYRDVLHAIDTGGAPTVRISDAVLALATVRGVYLSATTGQCIRIDDVLDGKYSDITVRTGH